MTAPDIHTLAEEMRARATECLHESPGAWWKEWERDRVSCNSGDVARCETTDIAHHIVASNPANVLTILDALTKRD